MAKKELEIQLKKFIEKPVGFAQENKKGLLFLGAFIFLPIIYYGYLSTEPRSNQSTSLFVKAIEGCEREDYVPDCYDALFAEYMTDIEVGAAVDAFKEAMIESAYVRQDCHQISHSIGRNALIKLGNIASVFQLDRAIDTCAGGFFHGAIEQLFRPNEEGGEEYAHIEISEIAKKVPTLCDAFENKKKSECLHGVGHGAFYLLETLYEDINPRRALDVCELFPEQKDHFSCYTGVYMEQMVSGTLPLAAKAEPRLACKDLRDPYKNPCHYTLTFHFTEIGLSNREIIAECRKTEGAAGAFCVRGHGIFRLAHEVLAGEEEEILTFCQSLDKTNGRVCAESVASRLAAHSRGGEDAMPFCSKFTSTYLRGRCFAYTADVLRLGYDFSKEDIKEECNLYANKPKECIKEI